MRYHWSECPACRCQIAVNTSTAGGSVTGSLRRWSTDRGINDGKPLRALVPDAAGGFEAECVCGALLRFGATPDAVGSERG